MTDGTRGAARVRRTAAAFAAATALALTLAACGGSDAGSDSGSPTAVQTASNGDVFNGADVQFASDMIQHHAQALAMVALADNRPLDPAVEKLTEQIRAAQAPEIETMTGWLDDWGQEIPATVNDHAHGGHDMDSSGGSGMDMGSDTGAGMPGMMSAEQMDQLENASDADFQEMWLRMMIEHHQGAIEMAKAEQADGAYDGAVALADDIIASQQREIDRMQQLLG